MRVLLVTDIHGDVENLERIVSRESFDSILCAGDLSDNNEYEDYDSNLENVLNVFEKEGVLTKAVPGNMDPEKACVKHLIERRMNLHKKIAAFETFEAVGFGGGQTPFDTPFEPEGEEIKNAVETLYERMNSDNRVAVLHQPPHNTELDVIEDDHVGSPEVRDILEDKEFDLLVTGHIHESRGRDNIKGTELVNPGPVMEGYYAVAEIDEDISVELKQL